MLGGSLVDVYTGILSRIEDWTVGGTSTITDCFFAGSPALEGGAIHVAVHSSLVLTDTTFIECSVGDLYSGQSFGGGCVLGSTSVQVSRCCGSSCYSDYYGQFIFLIGTNENANVAASSRNISQNSLVSCGNAPDSSTPTGGIELEAPIAAAFLTSLSRHAKPVVTARRCTVAQARSRIALNT
jgi:hypothetical protein